MKILAALTVLGAAQASLFSTTKAVGKKDAGILEGDWGFSYFNNFCDIQCLPDTIKFVVNEDKTKDTIVVIKDFDGYQCDQYGVDAKTEFKIPVPGNASFKTLHEHPWSVQY